MCRIRTTIEAGERARCCAAGCSRLKAPRRQAQSAPRAAAACGDTCGCFLVGVCEYTPTPIPARASRSSLSTCVPRPTLVLFRANFGIILSNQPFCVSVGRSSPSTRVSVSSASMNFGAILGEFCVDSVRPSILPVCTKRHCCLYSGGMHEQTCANVESVDEAWCYFGRILR